MEGVVEAGFADVATDYRFPLCRRFDEDAGEVDDESGGDA